MCPMPDEPTSTTTNRPQLITYVDRLAGDLAGLRHVLAGELDGAFGGVHLLPFFDPIDGADAGFDPADHTVVDPRLGDWSGVGAIGADFVVMADLIVNHVSSASPQFVDWRTRGDESEFAGMFLTRERVFPDGAADADIDLIYRPRPGRPFTDYEIAGRTRQVWTTFTSDQIDLDMDDPAAWAYLVSVLDRFEEGGVDLVRLDAVGYAIKRAGTTSFMIPETFAFIDRVADEARTRGMEVLVEIHSHHRFQIDVADRVDRVYDFALPPLVLHALHAGDAVPLRRWLEIAPRNCVTVLDTHDGIGIVDVAPEGDQPGLLEPDEVDALVEAIHDASEGRSRQATGAAASNLDLYQVNCTFFEALGSDDDAHFLARLIQVLCPGIPQVYYAGLLAAPNQMDLLAETGVGRDINRPYYDAASRAAALERPVVRDTLGLLRWRNRLAPVFDGAFTVDGAAPNELMIRWSGPSGELTAEIDVAAKTFRIDVDGEVLTVRSDFA